MADTTDQQIYEAAARVREIREAYQRLSALSSYATRRNVMDRLREAERQYHDILTALTASGSASAGSNYKPSLPVVTGGVDVKVEISLDGVYYSNPAPTVPVNSIIYVRATISDAHRGSTGIPAKTHEIAHLTWVPGKGYVAQDKIPAAGHDVFFVSQPLVITRKYKAPASKTQQNFLVYVDLYEPVPSAAIAGHTIFDEFTRTVASGWGTASSGVSTWTATTAINGTFSVAGGQGLMTASGTSYELNMTAHGPGLWANSSFTQTTGILIPSVSPAAGWSLFQSVVGNSASIYCGLYWTGAGNLKLELGDISGLVTYTSSVPMTNNDEIIIKWIRSGAILQGKFWRAAVAEPDWQLVYSIVNDTNGGEFYGIDFASTSTAATMRINDIDFS